MEPELSRMEAKIMNDLDRYALNETIGKEKAKVLRDMIRREEIDDIHQLRAQLLYYLANARTLFSYVYEEDAR